MNSVVKIKFKNGQIINKIRVECSDLLYRRKNVLKGALIMKKSRKLAAFVASILAVACMAAPMATSMTASAAATAGQITFTDATVGTHSYTAYKIFKGNVAKDTGNSNFNPTTKNEELQNVEWTDGFDSATFLAALKTDTRFEVEGANVFASCTTAAGVAKVLATYTYNSDGAKNFADFVVEQATKETNPIEFVNFTSSEGAISITEDGYFVIAETSLTPDDKGNGSMTSYLLGVYSKDKGAEVKVKSALPTFVKKIKDKDDSAIEDSAHNNDKWIDSADYDITDNVPFQLTATLPNNYADYDTYKLVFHDDLQKNVFTFNKDSVKVYYQKGDADPVGIENGFNLKNEGLSENNVFAGTKTDKIEDFTLTFNDLKTAQEGLAAGDKIIVEYTATLTDEANIGSAGNWNSAYLEYSNNPEYKGEGENSPTSHTPEDLNVAFAYEVDVNKIDGLKNPLNGAGFTLQKWDGTAYKDVKVIAPQEGETITTFSFSGIDAGRYKLVESTVPNGYNKANDLEFVVVATHEQEGDTPSLTKLEVKTLTGDLIGSSDANANITDENKKFTIAITGDDDGKLKTDIMNTSGSELPSTGGIGTTIFYVAGGALVVGAGVLLVSKKRMSNK